MVETNFVLLVPKAGAPLSVQARAGGVFVT